MDDFCYLDSMHEINQKLANATLKVEMLKTRYPSLSYGTSPAI